MDQFKPQTLKQQFCYNLRRRLYDGSAWLLKYGTSPMLDFQEGWI